MTLRVGRFKHKAVAGCYYIRSLAYAALTGCQHNVLQCGSARFLSHLSVAESAGSQHCLTPCERDPEFTGWTENPGQNPSSAYRDLLSHLTSVLGTNAKGDNSANLARTVSQGKYQKNLEPNNDTNLSKCNRTQTFKHESCDSELESTWSKIDIQGFNVSDKNFMQNASRAELKSNVEMTDSGPGDPKEPDREKTKPDQLDLERVKEYYIEKMPYFYKHNEDITLGLHHKDIVFENNYFQKQTKVQGITAYLKEQTRLRIIALFKFPSYFFQTVGATTHLDESCVKIHWRFYYIGNLEYITTYLYKRFQGVPIIDCYNFKDGISTFSVDKEGVIVKHQVDRLMPIQKTEVVNLRPKFSAKMASLIGLAPAPKTSFDTNSSFRKKTQTQS